MTSLHAPGAVPGSPRYAFKAGLDRQEQVWLWLGDERPFHVSTWEATDPVTTIQRSTIGYEEGYGRFGPLSFDHEGRFLLTSERVPASAAADPGGSWRFVAIELATGRVETTTPLWDRPPRTLVTDSATLVAESGRPDERTSRTPWLYEVKDGRVELALDAETSPLDVGFKMAVTLAGEPLVTAGRDVFRRIQGQWAQVANISQDHFWFWLHANAPGNAACLLGYGVGGENRTAWLVQADAPPRQLPCEGQVANCAFSPDGTELYLSGCAQPVLTLAGQVRSGPALHVFPDAHVTDRGRTRTLATLGLPHRYGDPNRPPETLALLDWTTLEAEPLAHPGANLLPDRCVVTEIGVGPDSATAVVKTHCGCIDCRDGTSFAIFFAPSKTTYQLIHAAQESLFDTSILLGKELVTAFRAGFDSGDQDDPNVLVTDVEGTRTQDLSPGIRGLVHGLVRWPGLD